MAAYVAPKDRVMEHSTSNSQTVFAVTGAIDTSYNAFSASMSVNDWTIGCVVEPGVAFASGILTYSATNQITINSTGFESKGTFSSSGTKDVFMGMPANAAAALLDALAYNGMQVNGSMDVSQVNGTTVVASGYVVDGFTLEISGSQVVSAAQVADAPPGYSNSIKVTVSTANASPGAGDLVDIHTSIEGYRVSRLAFGGASAQSVSIGFWTKIHRTGTYSGSIRNSGCNRSYPFSFTQNVADTWEFKTVTIPGDTTGTWLTTNGIGLVLAVSMLAGTTYQGTANAWAAADYLGVTGATNGVANTSDVFQITGFIVLPGIELPSATRTPFIMRPFDQEFILCQRYYETTFDYGTAIGTSTVNGWVDYTFGALSTGEFRVCMPFVVGKRAAPSMSFYDNAGNAGKCYRGGSNKALTLYTIGLKRFTVGTIDATSANEFAFHFAADARF